MKSTTSAAVRLEPVFQRSASLRETCAFMNVAASSAAMPAEVHSAASARLAPAKRKAVASDADIPVAKNSRAVLRATPRSMRSMLWSLENPNVIHSCAVPGLIFLAWNLTADSGATPAETHSGHDSAGTPQLRQRRSSSPLTPFLRSSINRVRPTPLSSTRSISSARGVVPPLTCGPQVSRISITSSISTVPRLVNRWGTVSIRVDEKSPALRQRTTSSHPSPA